MFHINVSIAQNFTDITESTGMAEVPFLIDTFGSGASIADYDNDGDLDIFVGTEFGVTSHVYENIGGSVFQEVSLDLGISTTYRIRSALWIDYDGDHLLDLVLLGDCLSFDNSCTNRIEIFLYRQTSFGNFIQIQNVGLSFGNRYNITEIADALAGGMAAGDINNDGWLDLIITVWGREFLGAKASVFLNNSDGTFADISESSGLGQTNLSRYQPVIHDFDDDGFQDIFINVDFDNNEFWKNNGNNTFTNIASSIGVDSAFNEMGIAIADYDNDNDFDLYSTNISRIDGGVLRHNTFFRNDKTSNNLNFAEIANDFGVGASGWDWGTTFFDANNDGWVDLATTNGYNQENWGVDQSRLWLNVDGLQFSDISNTSGFNDTKSAATLLAFDMDRDGDLDLLQSSKEDGDKFPIVLYENDSNTSPNFNNYLVVKPRMTGANHFAIGTVVKIIYNNGTQSGMRLITAGTSFYGQEPAEAFFGLANHSMVDEVIIEWPDNTMTTVNNISANQVIVINNDSVLSDSNNNNKELVNIFPNPVDDTLTINSKASIFSIIINDVLGQKVMRLEANSNLQKIDVSSLSKGIYFVKFFDSNDLEIKTIKIIKK